MKKTSKKIETISVEESFENIQSVIEPTESQMNANPSLNQMDASRTSAMFNILRDLMIEFKQQLLDINSEKNHYNSNVIT